MKSKARVCIFLPPYCKILEHNPTYILQGFALFLLIISKTPKTFGDR